jgi:hypothetical protein
MRRPDPPVGRALAWARFGVALGELALLALLHLLVLAPLATPPDGSLCARGRCCCLAGQDLRGLCLHAGCRCGDHGGDAVAPIALDPAVLAGPPALPAPPERRLALGLRGARPMPLGRAAETPPPRGLLAPS